MVLGSGEGGKYLAWTFAQQGKRVAVVERKLIGGACPNIACLPSKNVIHSAAWLLLLPGMEFGLRTESFQVDMAAVRRRKRDMVDGLIKIHLANFKSSGAELIFGHGSLRRPQDTGATAANTGNRWDPGNEQVIGTGTRATVDPIPGLLESHPLTHIEALELDWRVDWASRYSGRRLRWPGVRCRRCGVSEAGLQSSTATTAWFRTGRRRTSRAGPIELCAMEGDRTES